MKPPRQARTPRRECPACGKYLANLNPGPTCYACSDRDPVGPRGPKRRLPQDEIVAAYEALGNSTLVAKRFDLPRSSVWSVVERARRQGRLPPS